MAKARKGKSGGETATPVRKSFEAERAEAAERQLSALAHRALGQFTREAPSGGDADGWRRLDAWMQHVAPVAWVRYANECLAQLGYPPPGADPASWNEIARSLGLPDGRDRCAVLQKARTVYIDRRAAATAASGIAAGRQADARRVPAQKGDRDWAAEGIVILLRREGSIRTVTELHRAMKAEGYPGSRSSLYAKRMEVLRTAVGAVGINWTSKADRSGTPRRGFRTGNGTVDAVAE